MGDPPRCRKEISSLKTEDRQVLAFETVNKQINIFEYCFFSFHICSNILYTYIAEVFTFFFKKKKKTVVSFFAFADLTLQSSDYVIKKWDF